MWQLQQQRVKQFGWEGCWEVYAKSKQKEQWFFVDNSSAIALSKNVVFHKRMKHIDTKFHYIRELVNKGEIVLVFRKCLGMTNNTVVEIKGERWNIIPTVAFVVQQKTTNVFSCTALCRILVFPRREAITIIDWHMAEWFCQSSFPGA